MTLGASVFDPGFEIGGLDAGRAAMVRRLLPEFEALVARRRETAGQLTAGLRGLPGLILPAPRSGIQSSWLRFPAIFEDAGDRDAALYRLTTKGLGASTMYPVPVHKIPQAAEMVRGDFGPFPGAEKIARGLVTLPTHGAVRRRHGDEIIKIVRETLGAGT
ncbi:MAG: DegT/DnrJ/EryC1/StrS family aminotransferase [Deltaproteobacteria bacterium]|nr:DegT/DnrJ/EryC1/StrS family aminotransferase [Deltaproteobacteria bacterium]